MLSAAAIDTRTFFDELRDREFSRLDASITRISTTPAARCMAIRSFARITKFCGTASSEIRIPIRRRRVRAPR